MFSLILKSSGNDIILSLINLLISNNMLPLLLAFYTDSSF